MPCKVFNLAFLSGIKHHNKKEVTTVSKLLLPLFTISLAFCYSPHIHAYEPIDQSFCPPGYHPEGPSFAYDCVSNSTGEIEGRESSRTAREPDREVWEDRWGAIARGKAGGWGAVANFASERSAKEAALKQCQTTATTKTANCKISIIYYNQCVAYVWGASGGVSSSAVDVPTASKQAMAQCSKSSADCEVLYSDCSLPARIK